MINTGGANQQQLDHMGGDMGQMTRNVGGPFSVSTTTSTMNYVVSL